MGEAETTTEAKAGAETGQSRQRKAETEAKTGRARGRENTTVIEAEAAATTEAGIDRGRGKGSSNEKMNQSMLCTIPQRVLFPGNCVSAICFMSMLCLDIDECENSPCKLSNTACANVPGSYECNCALGFYMSSDNDTSECQGTAPMSSHLKL